MPSPDRSGEHETQAETLSSNTRTRLLTCRLTESEYELVKAVGAQQGARSISEFARQSVIYQLTRQGAGNAGFTDDLATLIILLRELDDSLKKAGSVISRLLGSGSRAAKGR